MAIVSERGLINGLYVEITRFNTNARVVIPRQIDPDNRFGCDLIAWESETDEAVALAQSVIRGECPPAIFADYMDEHPYRPSPISGPKAARLLRGQPT